MRGPVGLAAAVLTALLSRGGAAQSKLPEGKGRELVERACTQCHGLEGITRARMTKERWGEVVDDMASRGPIGTSEEIDRIIDYLAENFGKASGSAGSGAAHKVNVNKADAAALSTSLAVSPDMAAAIVQYREKNGPFKDAEALKKVPGVDAAKIDAAKERLEF